MLSVLNQLQNTADLDFRGECSVLGDQSRSKKHWKCIRVRVCACVYMRVCLCIFFGVCLCMSVFWLCVFVSHREFQSRK